MGNNCSVCGVKVDSGNYCSSCYQRKFPRCCHCQSPIYAGEETIGNYHRQCYDVKYPLPLRVDIKYQGAEFKYYSRDDDVIDKLQPLANRMINALEGPRGNQRMIGPP